MIKELSFLLIISTSVLCLKLHSDDIKEGEKIKDRFTPYGKDVNPSLYWSDVPEGTKSFALIVDDPDAPTGTFTHWAVYNIPGEQTHLAQGAQAQKFDEVTNSWGIKRYKGPQPPSGVHHYHFKLYALKAERLTASNLNQLRDEINKEKIEIAQIIALYGSKQVKRI